MKKFLSITILSILILTSMIVLVGCDNGKKEEEKGNSNSEAVETKTPTTKIKQSVYKYFNIEAEVEEIEDEEGNKVAKYEFTKEKPENAEYKLGNYYLVTDDVIIALKTDSFSFHTGLAYKEKHGTITPTFATFKEYINSDEYTGTLRNVEETTFAGLEALKVPYKYTDSTNKTNKHGEQYLVNIESIKPDYKGYVTVVITTAEGESGDIDATLSNKDVKALIDSIKFVKQ